MGLLNWLRKPPELPSPDGADQVAGLLVWNRDPKSKKKTWEAEPTVNDLDKIAHRFVALVLRDGENAV